jgi:hypothetical protein
MRPRSTRDDEVELQELPPELKAAVDMLVEEGPEMLLAVSKYFLFRTQDDPRWAELVQEVLRQSGLASDLDDGLIYKVKVTLKGFRPAVYRELELPNMTLGELHEILQTAMGWQNDHLHAFRVGQEEFGPVGEENQFQDWQDEESMSLGDLVEADQRRVLYEYDFGDGWEHDILISKPKQPKPGVAYPRCIKGELACPPEDCGGILGYLDLCDRLQELAPDRDDETEDLSDDYGEYDPKAFSIDDVNAAFAEIYALPTAEKGGR